MWGFHEYPIFMSLEFSFYINSKIRVKGHAQSKQNTGANHRLACSVWTGINHPLTLSDTLHERYN